MYLNFRCPACDNEIQAEYPHIGEWVVCPVCNFSQVVPDPLLPPGSSYGGYKIDRLFDANLLWYGYLAQNEQSRPQSGHGLPLMRVPTSFFLRNVSNLDAFNSELLRTGSSGVPGLATMIDKSMTSDKIFFVYDTLPELLPLSSFMNAFGSLQPDEALTVMENISGSMAAAMRCFGRPHLSLSPTSIMLTTGLDLRIFDYGVTSQLMPDPQLDGAAFNIWDPRYMSPEARAGVPDMNGPASDIFSLGAIAYLLLCGRDAYDYDALGRGDPFPSLPAALRIPNRFREIVRKMTSPMPANRYSSWDEVSAELAALRQDVGTSTDPSSAASSRSSYIGKRTPAKAGSEAVGLTHQSVKFDKKLKVRLNSKHKATDTIAKLIFPLKDGELKGLAAAAAKNAWTPKERLMMVGIVSLVVGVVVLGSVALLVFHSNLTVANKQDAQHPQKPAAAATKAVASADTAKKPGATEPILQPPPKKNIHPAQDGTKAAQPAEAAAAKPAHKLFDYSGLSSRIYAMVKDADDFTVSNPESFDEALGLYDKAIRTAVDSKDGSSIAVIQARIDSLLEKRDASLDALMKTLDAKAKPFIDAGDMDSAKKVYIDYEGPFKTESNDRRVATASKVARDAEAGAVKAKCDELEALARKQAIEGRFRTALSTVESYDGALAKETAPFRKDLAATLRKELKDTTDTLAPLVAKLAPLLASSELDRAQGEIIKAQQDPAFTKVRPQLERLALTLKIFSSFDGAFLNFMKENIGKPVSFRLKNQTGTGGSSLMMVSDVSNNKASVKITGTPRDITFKDLAMASKVSFAKTCCKIEEHPLLIALLAMQSVDANAFKTALPTLPFGFDALLTPGFKEQDAKGNFEGILDANNLPYDKGTYENALKTFGSKAISKDTAIKFHAKLVAFLTNFNDTSFVTANKPVIDGLDAICLRSGASAAERLEVDQEYLKNNKIGINEVMDKVAQGTVIVLKFGAYKGSVNISRDGTTIECEPGTSIDGGLKISARKVSVSNLECPKGRLEIVSANEVKLDSCAFLGLNSSVRISKDITLENCLLKGLLVISAKDFIMNHCTSVGVAPLDSKVDAGLLILSGELVLTNSIITSNGYGLVTGAKMDNRKVHASNSILFGPAGACTELAESGNVSKNSAKSENSLGRYLKATKVVVAEPKFVAPQTNDYTLESESPGSTLGSDGRDAGIIASFQCAKAAAEN